MKKNLVTILLSLLIVKVFSQNVVNNTYYPTVGKLCPEFTLQNIKYYNKTHANIKEFRGKWLMLDFWNRYCSACIASFPKTNEKRKKFSDKIEVILVGGYFPDPYSPHPIIERDAIEWLYDQQVKKESLQLPCAFDSTLTKQWDIYVVPYIVIIDPKGIVRAVTTGIGDEKIDSLLNGYSPKLNYAMRAHEDKGAEVRPAIDHTVFTGIGEHGSYIGPRFAFANENDFPIIVSTDNVNGWDTLAARQLGSFHKGDYRECLQVYNVTYELTNKNFRGKTNALHYKPEELKGELPTGDWILHFKWDKTWKVRAVKLDY